MRFSLKPTIITYITAAFIITFNFMTNPAGIGFGSDALYLPSLFSDVFVRGHHFSSWYFTPAPYFFPDMLIFFIINTFVCSVFYALLIFAIIQNCLILFLISKIASLVTKNKSSVLLTHIFYLLVLVFMPSGSIGIYGIVIKNAHHVGSLINGLLLIYLYVTYCKNFQKSSVFAIFLLTILGAVSDLLFEIQFVLPIIVSMVLIRLFKMKIEFPIVLFSFLFIAGSLIGYSVDCLFHLDNDRANFILPHTSSLLVTMNKIALNFKNIFLLEPVISIISVIFYLTLMTKCVISIVYRKKHLSFSEQRKWAIFLSFFILISAALTWGSAVVNSAPVMRYLLNIFWFPIFFIWLLFEKPLKSQALLIALYAISILAVIGKLSMHVPYEFSYIPEVVRCVDTHVSDYNKLHIEKIKYGISAYWQAKLTTIFSKEGIVISQYTKDLHPRLWITSAENYRDSYDFAILSSDQRLNVGLLEQLNGKPIITFKCNDKISLLIYGKERLRVPDYEIKQGAV